MADDAIEAIEIRELTESDAEALWQLRLHALDSEPSAFGESVGEHRQTPFDKYVARLRGSEAGNFVMGAFDGSALIGTAGFYRDSNLKERHKGHLWGVFVAQPYRRRGVGATLIKQLLNRVRERPDIEQVHLAVATVRPAARALYASLDFKSFGVEPRSLKIDGEYIDEEHMLLVLR